MDAHVAGVRATEAHRHPEPLGGADGDVRAPLSRRGGQSEREQVSGCRDQCAVLMGRRSEGSMVTQTACAVGVLDDDSEDVLVASVGPRRRHRRPPRSATTKGNPRGTARVRMTPNVWGKTASSTSRTAPAGVLLTRRMRVIASAAAVASSSRDEPARSRPVRSVTTVWKLSSASSRPWEISG